MALSLLQEWTGWGSHPEHQDPVLCSVVSWLRGGLCVCRVTIKVETLGGSGRELFGPRVLEMALNLWGPYLQARGGGGSPGPGSPATLEQGALAWWGEGGLTDPGLLFALRGLWPAALRGGAGAVSRLSSPGAKNCVALVPGLEREMRLERAQLGRITCSPLWKLPRAGRGSGIVIDLICSPGRRAACARRCGAGWGRGLGERLGSGSWRQAGCRAKAIRAAAGAPGSAGLAAAHGKARGGTDAPSAAPRFHCPGAGRIPACRRT